MSLRGKALRYSAVLIDVPIVAWRTIEPARLGSWGLVRGSQSKPILEPGQRHDRGVSTLEIILGGMSRHFLSICQLIDPWALN